MLKISSVYPRDVLFVPSGQKLIPGLNFFELLLLKVDMKSNEHNRVKIKKKKQNVNMAFLCKHVSDIHKSKTTATCFVYRPIPPYTDFKVHFL